MGVVELVDIVRGSYSRRVRWRQVSFRSGLVPRCSRKCQLFLFGATGHHREIHTAKFTQRRLSDRALEMVQREDLG